MSRNKAADHVALSRLSRNARDAIQRDLSREKESQSINHFYHNILEMRDELLSHPQ